MILLVLLSCIKLHVVCMCLEYLMLYIAIVEGDGHDIAEVHVPDILGTGGGGVGAENFLTLDPLILILTLSGTLFAVIELSNCVCEMTYGIQGMLQLL